MKKTVLVSVLTLFLLILSACGPKTYKVTFDAMNGTTPVVVSVEESKRVGVPTNPDKTGFIFEGWYLGDQRFDFNNKITSDKYIYAKWTERMYTVTFVLNNGLETAPVQVAHGALVAEPTEPVKTNYDFKHWALDDNDFDFSTPITSSITLYAIYDAIMYQVFFDTLGGSEVSTQTIMSGSLATTPAEPTKDGFRFLGWYIGDTAFNFATPITSTTIISAKWAESVYSGYYEGMDGLTGTNLIIFLNALLEEMNGKDYGFARTALQVTDRDPANSTNLIEFYTGESYTAAWDGGATWNREHVWPQSLLGESAENSTVNSASDLQNLTPANPSINSSRSNKWYGPVTATESYLPDRAEIRGDIARILFYMDIRYDNLKLVNLTGNQSPSVYQMGDLATLLQWHVMDPVDDFERNRNEVIFGYQQNRNPFIDHPELVSYIYN